MVVNDPHPILMILRTRRNLRRISQLPSREREKPSQPGVKHLVPNVLVYIKCQKRSEDAKSKN